MYGDSEDLIGKWFKRTGKRDQVRDHSRHWHDHILHAKPQVQIFLATKFANVMNPDGTREVRNEPEYVKAACEKSMKRLGVDHIDLYYCHRLSGKVPIETVVKAMAELVK